MDADQTNVTHYYKMRKDKKENWNIIFIIFLLGTTISY